ncbi:MAG: hypothetical protein IJT43_09870 [Stomatobaculum sp.]|nr:hypothetical protein [Stomatobaculum sp.]
MRKLAAAALTAAMALSMTTTAYAVRGWVQDEAGNYRFYLNDNVYVTSGYTEDGFWVDVNGIWDGSASIGTLQEDGNYEIIKTPFDDLDIRGDMILRSKGDPVLDEENIWHVKVDVLDTGFASAAELRQIQAGDILEFPGLGFPLTALTRGKPTVYHAANEEKGIQSSTSGYRVTCTDEAGNTYVLTKNRLRKTSADGSQTETILREVAQDVEIEIPGFMGVEKAGGTTQTHTMQYILENGMMFKADMKGTRVTNAYDVSYNYNTTTATEYDEHAAHGNLVIKRE